MKRIITSVLAGMFVLLPGFAQTMDSIFANAPSEVLPLLEKTERLNLLDFYNSGMEAAVDNSLFEQCVLLEKNDSVLTLQTSKASELKIVLLRSRGIILCLHTLQLPTRQTFLDVYDKAWNKCRTRVTEFKTKDFFRGTTDDYTSERLKNLIASLTPIHYIMTWNFERERLVCSPSFDRVMNSDKELAGRYFSERTVKLEDIFATEN